MPCILGHNRLAGARRARLYWGGCGLFDLGHQRRRRFKARHFTDHRLSHHNCGLCHNGGLLLTRAVITPLLIPAMVVARPIVAVVLLTRLLFIARPIIAARLLMLTARLL